MLLRRPTCARRAGVGMGVRVGRNRVARLLRVTGRRGISPRHTRRATNRPWLLMRASCNAGSSPRSRTGCGAPT